MSVLTDNSSGLEESVTKGRVEVFPFPSILFFIQFLQHKTPRYAKLTLNLGTFSKFALPYLLIMSLIRHLPYFCLIDLNTRATTKWITQSKFCLLTVSLLVSLWCWQIISAQGLQPVEFTWGQLFFLRSALHYGKNFFLLLFFLLGLLANKVQLVIVYYRLHRVLQCFDVPHLNLTILWQPPKGLLVSDIYSASASCIAVVAELSLWNTVLSGFCGIFSSFSWRKLINKSKFAHMMKIWSRSWCQQIHVENTRSLKGFWKNFDSPCFSFNLNWPLPHSSIYLFGQLNIISYVYIKPPEVLYKTLEPAVLSACLPKELSGGCWPACRHMWE